MVNNLADYPNKIFAVRAFEIIYFVCSLKREVQDTVITIYNPQLYVTFIAVCVFSFLKKKGEQK